MIKDNNHLEYIAENTKDVIFIKDKDGVYQYLNRSALEFIGKKLEEVLGKDDQAIFPPEVAKNLMATDKKIIDSRAVSTLEETAVSASGKTTFFLSTKGPIFDTEGNVVGIFGIARDITKDKELENKILKSEAFLKNVLENIPTMIFIKDAKELRFTHINKAAEDLLGYSKKELLGKNDLDFFPKEQADFFADKDQAVIASKSMLDIPEEVVTTKFGKRILHTKKIALLDENGDPAYLLGISEDITEKKQNENILKEKLMEIKKINEMMLDREIKMVELKKQLEDCTSKLQSKN